MQKNEPIVEDPTIQSSSLITYILLAIVIVQGFLNLYLLMGNSISLPASITADTIGVKKALLELEYDKVGGKANYDLMSQATRLQMKEQIPQIEQYIKTQWGKTPDTTTPVQAENQVLDAAKVDAIMSGTALEGNSLAEIVVIEYSDMECPFCIRQYAETKLRESLVTQYGDKVVFAYKNNKWVNHPGTEAKAIGALCAKKVGGNTAYAAEFAAETLEANGLGLGGTPGTLILNVKTGKYATVEGAYPMTTFVEKINSVMN